MNDPWIERAKSLRNLLREAAPRTEAERRLPDDVVGLLGDAGFFRLSVPKTLGGPELSLSTQLRVIEHLAWGDAAAGWCVMIASTTSLAAAFMEEATAKEVFGDPNVWACGVYAPMGRAKLENGGYRVSGRWPFGSGGHHSHFRVGGALVKGDDGPPEMRLMVFTEEQTEVLDTWDTLGLRGTGSHDFTVEGAFVPAHLALTLGDIKRGELLYQTPFFGFLAVQVAAVSLGVARAALDTLRDVATAKVPTGSRRTVAQKGGAQVAYAEAEARWHSARAWLVSSVRELEEAIGKAAEGEKISVDAKAHLRLAAIHAVRECADVTTAMLRLGGGSAIYRSHALQRFFRDANTATAHAMVSPLMIEYLGKVLLGQTDDHSKL